MKAAPFLLGTSTSIGSLPHLDRDAAIRFQLDHCPQLPAAPTLPNLDPRELMVPQGLWGVKGIDVAETGAIAADLSQIDPEAPLGDPDLQGAPFASLRPFLDAVAGTDGPVKFQVAGPVTLGLVLRDAGLADDLAFTIAGAAVRQRLAHLLEVVRGALPESPLVVFLDEPGLVGGLGERIGLGAEQVIDLVSGALAAVEGEAMSGVHCCGPADWNAIVQAGPEIISMPVDAEVTAAAGPIGGFLEEGGWIAWGAVPTDGPLGQSAVRLWRVLSNQWCELVRAGCDPVLVRHQALITPQCGLAGHSLTQADQVMELSRRVGERLRDQVANVMLSVGA